MCYIKVCTGEWIYNINLPIYLNYYNCIFRTMLHKISMIHMSSSALQPNEFCWNIKTFQVNVDVLIFTTLLHQIFLHNSECSLVCVWKWNPFQSRIFSGWFQLLDNRAGYPWCMCTSPCTPPPHSSCASIKMKPFTLSQMPIHQTTKWNCKTSFYCQFLQLVLIKTV